MTDDIERIKTRIRKLLALSKSPNENEAMAAIEKANTLLRELGLTERDVAYTREPVRGTKRDCPWRLVLVNAVSWLNGTIGCINKYRGEYEFIGSDINVLMAKEMYVYMIRAVERIAAQKIRRNARASYRSSFKYGIALNLKTRIHELGEKALWFDRVGQQSAILKWLGDDLSNHEIGKEKNNRALVAGFQAGETIELNRQATGMPQKSITG